MENPISDVESLFEKAGDYVETRLDLFKLRAVDKSSDIISSLITTIIIALVSSIVFLILNIGIALWLGSLLGKIYYGFFIVAGFYAIIGLIIYSVKSSVWRTNADRRERGFPALHSRWHVSGFSR